MLRTEFYFYVPFDDLLGQRNVKAIDVFWALYPFRSMKKKLVLIATVASTFCVGLCHAFAIVGETDGVATSTTGIPPNVVVCTKLYSL